MVTQVAYVNMGDDKIVITQSTHNTSMGLWLVPKWNWLLDRHQSQQASTLIC